MPKFWRQAMAAMALATTSCSGPADGPPVPPPMLGPSLNPADPASIGRWEQGPENVSRSKIAVAELSRFRGALTKDGHGEPKPVAVEMIRGLDEGVAPEQAAALKQLQDAESDAYAAVRKAIYDQYRADYPMYSQVWGVFGGDSVLPKIVNGDELDGLVSIYGINVGRPEGGVAAVGILLHTPWNEEDDMGVVLKAGTVVEVGNAHVAIDPSPPPAGP